MSKFNNLFFFGSKKLEYYSDLLIRADYKEHEHIFDVILDLYPNGCRVLDMGCGQGAFSKRLVDNGYDVTAVDIDPEDFKCHDSINFIKLDFNDEHAVTDFLNTNNSSFDLVLGIEVIEHVENPWAYVRMLKSLVKKNGHLLITTPNVTSWVSRFIFLFRGKFHQFDYGDLSYGHIAPITSYHLSVIYDAENLKNLKIIKGGTLPMFFIPNLKPQWLFINFLNLFFVSFMKGNRFGWCIITTAERID
jgi:SAM-dependent methyltransferase